MIRRGAIKEQPVSDRCARGAIIDYEGAIGIRRGAVEERSRSSQGAIEDSAERLRSTRSNRDPEEQSREQGAINREIC